MANSRKQALSAHEGRPSILRHVERQPISLAALIHCHGRFQTVRIVDFSPGGLQLQGCFGVGAGEDIEVEFLSGHRLPAKVAWSMGSRVGVRYLQQLSAGHPALTVLQEAAHPTHGHPHPNIINYVASKQ